MSKFAWFFKNYSKLSHQISTPSHIRRLAKLDRNFRLVYIVIKLCPKLISISHKNVTHKRNHVEFVWDADSSNTNNLNIITDDNHHCASENSSHMCNASSLGSPLYVMISVYGIIALGLYAYTFVYVYLYRVLNDVIIVLTRMRGLRACLRRIRKMIAWIDVSLLGRLCPH